MLSIPDLAIVGVFALLVFGPDKLPGVMRKAGHVMRDIQNTSQGFIREMEHAADVTEPPKPWAPPEHSEDPAYPMHGYGATGSGDELHHPTAEELDAIVAPLPHQEPLPEVDHAPVAMQHELAQTPDSIAEATLHPGKATPEPDHSANI